MRESGERREGEGLDRLVHRGIPVLVPLDLLSPKKRSQVRALMSWRVAQATVEKEAKLKRAERGQRREEVDVVERYQTLSRRSKQLPQALSGAALVFGGEGGEDKRG